MKITYLFQFKIDLTKPCTTATATGKYAAVVRSITNYKFNGEPFDKVLVIQIHNEGEPDSDYERERDLDEDED